MNIIILVGFIKLLVFDSSIHLTKQQAPVRGHSVEATVMTSQSGGPRLANGKINDANTRPFVALPSRRALGKKVWVFCPKTNKTIRNIPVMDVGPWSYKDDYWNKGTRPLAERGISDIHKKVTNKAGIDLSLKLCRDFGLSYPFKGQVVWGFE